MGESVGGVTSIGTTGESSYVNISVFIGVDCMPLNVVPPQSGVKSSCTGVLTTPLVEQERSLPSRIGLFLRILIQCTRMYINRLYAIFITSCARLMAELIFTEIDAKSLPTVERKNNGRSLK